MDWLPQRKEEALAEHASVREMGTWPATRHRKSLGLMMPLAERSSFGGTPHFADVLEMSHAARETGFEVLWFADHFSLQFQPDGPLNGTWDAWTLMAGVAAAVPDVYIGPMVACTAYRNAGVIAKMTEMIEDISGGRFILGLGAGWHKQEYDQFGMPFEPRVTRFEEALAIIHGLIRSGAADVQGTYSQANNAVNLPRASRKGGTPIMFGSSGERMLRLLATWADGWNTSWYGSSIEGLASKVQSLEFACAEVGRDPATIWRTVGVNVGLDGYLGVRPNPFSGSPNEIAAYLHQYVDLGFHHVCIGLDPCTPESIRSLRPVLDEFFSYR